MKHLNLFEFSLKPSRAVFKNPLMDRGAILSRGQKIETEDSADTIATFMPTAAQQALSGAGVALLSTYYTAWTSTSTDALTLADGQVIGQLKKIQLIVDGGTGTLTPATFVNGASIAFADAGDFVVLVWTGVDGWAAIELGNGADGATAPVIS